MKMSLIATFLSGALIAATTTAIPAAALPRAGEYQLSQADACLASCKANVEYCRSLCSNPEEQSQCIVDCGSGECKANCDKFEAACKERCKKAGG
jgi:predicted metal-binding membrane protein